MGPLPAPAWAMPRSATVHSTRVAPTSETLSPGLTPTAIRPQAASAASPPSSPQVSGFHPPPALRSAATRCASAEARSRNNPATERTVAKSSLSLCIEPIVFCAVAIGSPKSGLGLPPAGQVLDALLLGRIAASLGVEDLLHQLVGLVVLALEAVHEQRVGQVQLGAPVAWVRAHRDPQHPDRLVQVALRPGQLEEVPAPHHLRRSVEEVLVDAQRREQALAKLAFQPLRERGQDPHAFRVEAHADAGKIVAAHVSGVRLDGLVAGLPGDLPFGGLLV